MAKALNGRIDISIDSPIDSCHIFLMFSVHPAQLTDVSELAQLVNSAYRGKSSRSGWTTEADFLEGQRTDPEILTKVLEKPNCKILCLRSTATSSSRSVSTSKLHSASAPNSAPISNESQTKPSAGPAVGPIIGCVYLERFEDKRGAGCYLGMLTVDPRQQSSGIGRVLLEESEDFARNWGALRITLGVIQLRDSLIEWYERRGYKKTGETRPFPYGDPKAGTPLRNDLHFVMFEKEI